MPARRADHARLQCHPDTPCTAVRAVDVCVRREGSVLALTYRLEGDLARVRAPAPRPRGIATGLWRNTCFEIFIACKDRGPAYHELNLAPSGQWAAYGFARYREGGLLKDEQLDPRITVSTPAPACLTLEATVDLDRLSPRYAGSTLAVALSCVVETSDGALSYWALMHPPGRPDFHHPDAFVLALPGGADVCAAHPGSAGAQ